MASTKTHWSYLAGERGRNRVRVFAHQTTGVIQLEYYDRGDRKRRSLGHRDRDRAKTQADEVAAKLGKALTVRSDDITLLELFDIYSGEVTPRKTPGKQGHDRSCVEMLSRFLGRSRQAKSLSRRDWDAFIEARRKGTIAPAQARVPGGVGDRQIGYDLKFLLSVLTWATQAGDGHGGTLLERNPLRGLTPPKEESPARPMMPERRYQAMLETASGMDWRFAVALVLAHETGHRISSIRQLRWSNVDLERGTIRWPKASDKIGFEHETPLTAAAVDALRTARTERAGIGDAWVLPSPGDPAKPCSRHLMRDWWLRCERRAELPHIKQMGWHSLRRKFAT